MQSVQTAAEQFVLGQLPSSTARHYATAGRPDAHVQVEECSRPLETFAAHQGPIGARTTVVVKCVGDTSWTLYVPVAVEVEVPVLVLKRALARRSRVEPLDVEVQVRRLPGTELNFINDPAALQGHRLKRPLAAGAPVTVDALTPEVVVRRGQRVTLLASSAVEIRAHASRETAARDRALAGC
jgi:flagella basal body P-ring formation protein FlgA